MKWLSFLLKSLALLSERIKSVRSIICVQAPFFFEAITSESLTEGWDLRSKGIDALQELLLLLDLLISERLWVRRIFLSNGLLRLILIGLSYVLTLESLVTVHMVVKSLAYLSLLALLRAKSTQPFWYVGSKTIFIQKSKI